MLIIILLIVPRGTFFNKKTSNCSLFYYIVWHAFI